jgi:hypothetical protein
MARDFNGSTMYANQNSSPITAYPLTVACWMHLDRVNTVQVLVQPVGKNASDQGQLMYLDAAAKVNAFSNDGSGSAATGTVAVSLTTWTHAAAVFASATDRRVYTNGADKQTNATSRAMVVSPDRMAIAAQFAAAGISNFTDGRFAEVGIWNVTLDDAEIAALAKGFCPKLIRPQSLIAYWPLAGNASPEPDGWRSKLDMTLNAAPSKADHPRIYYPDR